MYRRKLMFLMILVLLMTGCVKITNDLDSVVETVISSRKTSTNTVSMGYELYIPTGVKQSFDSEYNQVLKVRNTNMYLYVDTISYYYKNMLNYKPADSYDYYYRKIANNDKTGYIGINKSDNNLLYGEIVYNYTKIEFYTEPSEVAVVLANALIIQNSIKFNDELISVELENRTNDGRELKYELDSPKDTESTFSDYLQEYVPEEEVEVELPDDN